MALNQIDNIGGVNHEKATIYRVYDKQSAGTTSGTIIVRHNGQSTTPSVSYVTDEYIVTNWTNLASKNGGTYVIYDLTVATNILTNTTIVCNANDIIMNNPIAGHIYTITKI